MALYSMTRCLLSSISRVSPATGCDPSLKRISLGLLTLSVVPVRKKVGERKKKENVLMKDHFDNPLFNLPLFLLRLGF